MEVASAAWRGRVQRFDAGVSELARLLELEL
jgi:hypothetical protein